MVYTKIIEASLLLPTPGGYVITPVSLFLCFSVCLSAGLQKNLRADFDETLWEDEVP